MTAPNSTLPVLSHQTKPQRAGIRGRQGNFKETPPHSCRLHRRRVDPWRRNLHPLLESTKWPQHRQPYGVPNQPIPSSGMAPSPSSKRKSSRRLPSYCRKGQGAPTGKLLQLRQDAAAKAQARGQRETELHRGTLVSTSNPPPTPSHRQGGVAAKQGFSYTLEQLLQTLTLFSPCRPERISLAFRLANLQGGMGGHFKFSPPT